jgi:hypothetical protein
MARRCVSSGEIQQNSIYSLTYRQLSYRISIANMIAVLSHGSSEDRRGMMNTHDSRGDRVDGIRSQLLRELHNQSWAGSLPPPSRLRTDTSHWSLSDQLPPWRWRSVPGACAAVLRRIRAALKLRRYRIGRGGIGSYLFILSLSLPIAAAHDLEAGLRHRLFHQQSCKVFALAVLFIVGFGTGVTAYLLGQNANLGTRPIASPAGGAARRQTTPDPEAVPEIEGLQPTQPILLPSSYTKMVLSVVSFGSLVSFVVLYAWWFLIHRPGRTPAFLATAGVCAGLLWLGIRSAGDKVGNIDWLDTANIIGFISILMGVISAQSMVVGMLSQSHDTHGTSRREMDSIQTDQGESHPLTSLNDHEESNTTPMVGSGRTSRLPRSNLPAWLSRWAARIADVFAITE